MADKKIGLGILVMMLVYGMAIVGCTNNGLNGTWDIDEGDEWIIFDNGNVTVGTGQSVDGRGTYSVSGSTLTLLDIGEAVTANYSVSGNKLTLTLMGETRTFTRRK